MSYARAFTLKASLDRIAFVVFLSWFVFLAVNLRDVEPTGDAS